MAWGAIASLAGSLIGAGASMYSSAQSAKAQKEALEQQKKQLETQQKNIADTNKRNDAAQKNAMETSSSFQLNGSNTQDQNAQNQGIMGGSTLSGGLTNSALPMERM